MTEKCLAKTKAGNACKGRPLPGSEYCLAHQPVSESTPKQQEDPNLCGHVNRHAYDKKGEIENLTCTKPKGHKGPHGAEQDQIKRVYDDVSDERVWTEWLDAAGTPVDQIKPVKEQEARVIEEAWSPK